MEALVINIYIYYYINISYYILLYLTILLMIPLINFKMISALRTKKSHSIVLGRRSSTISTLLEFKEYVPFVTISLTSFGFFIAPSYFLFGEIQKSNIKTDALSTKIDSKFYILHSDMSKVHNDISKILMKHEGDIATLQERTKVTPWV